MKAGSLELFPNGPLWDSHIKRALLRSENRIPLVYQLVVGSFAHTFIANSNWRTRLAQPTNAADTSLYAVVGQVFRQRRTISPPRRIIFRRFSFTAVSRGFIRRICAPSGQP